MFRAVLILAVGLSALLVEASVDDYIQLQETCDPAVQNKGVVTKENAGKVCFPGSVCNPQTKICDCSDSDDGKWKRTWETDQCKLMPGSTCVNGVSQDFYRCVNNAKCVQTRVGKDDPRKCLADAPCDLGDYNCKCDEGKTCLNTVVPAPSKQ